MKKLCDIFFAGNYIRMNHAKTFPSNGSLLTSLIGASRISGNANLNFPERNASIILFHFGLQVIRKKIYEPATLL